MTKKLYFNNDKKLKNSGVQQEFTNEQKIEIIKCKRSFDYFCNNYIKIPDQVTKKLIPFKIRPYQERMTDALVDNNRVIVLAPRQCGKSVLVIAYMLWFATFNKYQNMVLVADREKTVKKTLKKLQNMYKELPFWLKQGLTEWNKLQISFENETNIYAEATSSAGNRGDTASLVYLDECAVIPSNLWEEFYTAVYPSIASNKNAKIIMTSTPKGYNHFHSFWNGAIKGNNDYKPIRVKWDEVPGRDEKYRETTIKALGGDDRIKGLRKWNQEYECKFTGSGGTLIESHHLEKVEVKDAIHSSMENSFVIFKNPEICKVYMCISDVAEGVGEDSSTVQVLELNLFKKKYKQVARYKNNYIKTNDFPTVIKQIAEFYNMALVLVEANTLGGEVLHRLVYDLEYENVFFDQETNKNNEYGIKVNKANKKIGCSYLKSHIENSNTDICDYMTLQELSQFVKKGDTYKADEKANDDLVMPLVLFSFFITKKQYVENWFDIENMNTKSKMSVDIENELLPPLGYINNGHETINLEEVVGNNQIDDFDRMFDRLLNK